MNHLPLETKRRLVAELGLRHVVALCPRQDPDWWDLDDAGLVAYQHHPFPDGDRIPGWITELAYELATAIRHGDGVLIHCNQGRNRSGLLAALVACNVEGWPGQQALDHVRARRPGSLANPAFVTYLARIA